MKSGVYRILNTVNGKFYIGRAAHLQRRWNVHRCLLRANRHNNNHLQRAWNKYGEAAFEFTVIVHCEPDDLVIREQRYLDSADWSFLYNRSRDARTSGTPSAQTRLKMSESAKRRGANRPRGWRPSAEAILKMRAAKVGKSLSPATQFAPGFTPWNKGKKCPEIAARTLGRRVSDETRRKLSIAHLGKKQSAESRAKRSATLRIVFSSPEVRAHRREEQLRRWADPECREAMMAARKQKKAS